MDLTIEEEKKMNRKFTEFLRLKGTSFKRTPYSLFREGYISRMEVQEEEFMADVEERMNRTQTDDTLKGCKDAMDEMFRAIDELTATSMGGIKDVT